MSSGEERERTGEKSRKKRRVGRACDMCRQKKVRCDGEQRPGLRCSNCVATDDKCTFVHDAPKRRSRPRGYVERLEQRAAQMEEILNEMFPGTDLSRGFDAAMRESARLSDNEYDIEEDDEHDHPFDNPRPTGDHDTDFAYAIPPSLGSPPLSRSKSQPALPVAAFGSTTNTGVNESELDPSDDELKTLRSHTKPGFCMDPTTVASFSGSMIQHVPPSLNAPDLEKRFFGKSSTVTMLKTAVDMRNNFWQSEGVTPDLVSRAFPESTPESDSGQHNTVNRGDQIAEGILPCGCPDYGVPHPLVNPPAHPPFVFPHADLMRQLVDLYFDVHNNYVPILHRPTFERALEAGEHTENVDFGEVVLLVCALGARWCNDRGVLVGVGNDNGTIPDGRARDAAATGTPFDDGHEGDEEEDWHSAGWKWFKQVRIARKMLLHAAPNLYDLQIDALSATYLRGSSVPEASRWIMGIGIRLAQDMGVHRKRSYSSTPNPQEEQIRRAFWALVWLDWSLSPNLGRSCAIQHEDFDLDLPLECDDEYWDTSPPFSQPAGKLSKIAYFNCLLRLYQIQGFALRTLYSTSKSKTILGFVGPHWEERILTELDTALAQWLGNLPQHLRWDPRNQDPIFLIQSALLHVAHSTIKIMIHRPFIGIGRKAGTPTLTTTPNMDICVKAARACVHVFDILGKRLGHGSRASLGVMSHHIIQMLTVGIVLMLHRWCATESRRESERDMVREMKEMAEAHRIMEILKNIEGRWHTAGRLWDMLYGLAVARDLPLPSSSHASVVRSTSRMRRPPTKMGSSSTHTKRSASIPSALPSNRGAQDLVAVEPKTPELPHMVQRSFSQRVPSTVTKHSTESDAGPSRPRARVEFDLTPSIFAPPGSPIVPGPSEPPTPSLDSMFAQPSIGSTSAGPSSTHPWMSDISTMHEPSTMWDPNAEAGGAGSGVAQPATDAIAAEVLDTIQSRRSTWVPTAARQQQWSPQDIEAQFMQDMYAQTAAGTFPPQRLESLPEMWSAAPLGIEWDEWGSYIHTYGPDVQNPLEGGAPISNVPQMGPSRGQHPHQPHQPTSPRTRQYSTLPFR